MSIKDIKNEIEKRKKYGLEFINIHGIGEDNKKKIEKVTSEFSKTGYYKIERYISEEKNVIFIRITRKSSS
jgi:basic membrane lipoprotein Med (substrate-binding protein (PBP1-ABC) superfamily)